METEIIEEGDIELEVPEGRIYDQDVFYNPKMTFDRNLSVAITSLVEPNSLCDALSATGVRGIRYKEECGVPEVWLNDINPKAVALIEENCERNEVDCEIYNEDAAVLLRKKMHDFIDIDPFGSPAWFLDAVSYSIKNDGFIGITATDTSSFFGTYPRVSRRRYGRKSMNTDYNKELGLRILVSALIESLGRYKKTFVPKLCYFREHYARICGEVKEGATVVQDNFRNFGYISHCFSCGWRKDELKKKCPECGEETEYVEVYLGKLNDKEFCEEVMKEARNRGFYEEARLAEKLTTDMEVPYHYDLHYLGKKQGLEIPKTEEAVKKLKDNGHSARISPYSPTAIKTDATFSEINKLL
ncbi:MAG: tRNA (guanine(10)-N(2))-dimethyltransferase [Candidatus Aenigmatarchaeota archaeon]